MSKKSMEPTSNLDKIAYLVNIIVIVCAIASVIIATIFLKQATIYSYYIAPAVFLLIGAVVSVISAILGLRFIIKTIIKHRA
ncbi:MAG: hypothetical protein ACTSRZ_16270 [Promethearchaeota archaeon]